MEAAPLDSQAGESSYAIPRATRWLATIATVLTGIAAIPGVGAAIKSFLALVPQFTIGRFYVWNVVSGGFFEVHPLSAVLTVPALLLLGRWMEPVWGGREFVLFSLVVNVTAGFSTFVFSMVAYFVSRSQSYIFTPIASVSGLVVGLLVAVKQIFPEHRLVAGGIGIRVKFLPFLCAVLVTTAAIARQLSPAQLVHQLAAMKFAWVYLRFFQRRELGRGDLGDAFAAHTFYPEPLSSILKPFFSIGFILCRPFVGSLGQSGASSINASASKSGSVTSTVPVQLSSADPVDAERRRRRALAALDARLSMSKSEPVKFDDSV